MKVAITDEGEIGREIAKNVSTEVVVLDNPSKVYSLKPDVLIHTLEVNYYEAERNRPHAWNINTWLTVNLARAASKVGAVNVLISSFMVFNGRRGYYKETSTPEPLNYYGITKLAAEMGVSALGNFLILRTGAIYSLSYRGFLFPYIRSLLLKGIAKCNQEFYISPISVRTLAKVIAQLLHKGATGVINVGGRRIDLCTFMRNVAEAIGGNVMEVAGRKMDFSIDDWLLRTFDIKVNFENELGETLHGRTNHEGEDTAPA